MKQRPKKSRLGIVGCGAIGSRIALSVLKELAGHFMVSALYDVDTDKAVSLSKNFKNRKIVKASLEELLAASDVVVESVNTAAAADVVTRALKADKDVLAMSVGRLFGKNSLFLLARRSRGRLILPSGALAGLDAVKAARLGGLRRVTLTTRKPPAGFKGNAFLAGRHIDLNAIRQDTLLFQGNVRDAVAKFPQNINVAAALAIAAEGVPVQVRIIASPSLSRNTHEVFAEGKAGTVRAVTENVPCPDNPKTSYLAVLSGIQALKQIVDPVRVGT